VQHTVQRCLVYSAECVEGSAGDKTLIRGEMSKCRVCYLLSVWLQAVEERRMWPVCLPITQCRVGTDLNLRVHRRPVRQIKGIGKLNLEVCVCVCVCV